MGEDLERQEGEESDIVKEPEGAREDSSLKRGASKISRALVCQNYMISEQLQNRITIKLHDF